MLNGAETAISDAVDAQARCAVVAGHVSNRALWLACGPATAPILQLSRRIHAALCGESRATHGVSLETFCVSGFTSF